MDEQNPEQQVSHERVDDFVTGYANNVRFEPSAWDLKIVFGELSQTAGKVSVEQHTSITVTWAEAKVMAYYLKVQIALYEFLNGRIPVPKSVVPPSPATVPADVPDKESAERIRQIVEELREKFVAEL